MKGRPTVDIVVILLTAMVAGVVLFSTVGIIVGRLMRPEADFKAGAEAIGQVVNTVIGALVGFVGGRAYGRVEAGKLEGGQAKQ